jgi:hypothetical protein
VISRIAPRIARRSIDSSDRLGRHRSVVEGTLASLLGFRCLGVRNERRATLLRIPAPGLRLDLPHIPGTHTR